MISPPPWIDDNGDMQLHGRQSGNIYFDFFEDDGVTPIDMSARTVVFEVGPDINVTLTSVVGDTNRLRLVLDAATVDAIFNAEDKQFVLNEAGLIYMEGIVYTRGWIE